jgi:hypothetical protein
LHILDLAFPIQENLQQFLLGFILRPIELPGTLGEVASDDQKSSNVHALSDDNKALVSEQTHHRED